MHKPSKESIIRVKVFVEGLTEKNYIEGFKCAIGNKHVIVEKPVVMGGGGYSSFLAELKKRKVTAGYSAVFVVIDYDKACENKTELQQFSKIVNWCKGINKCLTVPYFLIVNNPRIEHFACLHFSNYCSQPCNSFILDNTSYRNLDEFKSDPHIYSKLNHDSCSIENACSKSKRINMDQRVLYNVYQCNSKGLDYTIKVSNTIHNHNNSHINYSNFYEFFDVVLKRC